MKYLPLLLILGFSLSLCNLTNKLREAGKSGDSNKSSPVARGTSADVEQPVPTAAQIAALAGGQGATWDRQGMSWSVPPKWEKATEEERTFVWRSPGSWDAASLIVSISAMDESFPIESSINAFYEQAMTRAKNGEVDEFKWLEIDGLKGVEFRESNPEKPDDQRRLQWLAYRKYGGQVQLVNLMLATRGKDFSRHQDAMYGILYSTKVAH
jgi:hypothetical protein